MRKRLEAYTMATELKNVARPQPEMRTKQSEPRRKNNAERGRAASSKNASVGIATEPRFTASVLRLTTK